MKKLLLLGMMLLGIVGGISDVSAAMTIGTKLTSVAQLEGKKFAIINEVDGKAIFNSMDGYDMGYDVYATAFTKRGFLFQLESAGIENCYFLRALDADGQPYGVYGEKAYFQSQKKDDANCCFYLDLGIGTGTGADAANTAVWEIQYVADKGFTLLNKGTEKYYNDPTKDAGSDTPGYFTFCELEKGSTINKLDQEITDINYLIGGGRFIIANTTGTAIQSYKSSEANASETSVAGITSDLYFYFTIEALPPLDVDGNGENDNATYYRVAIQNADGTPKPSNWWGDNYVNRIGWGDLWSTTCAADKENGYGRDGEFNAVWTITYVEGSGFTFYNPKNNKYMTLSKTVDNVTYLKLYKEIIEVPYLLEDPKIFTWEDLNFDDEVTVDNEARLVVDSRAWSQYWSTSAHWDLPVGEHDLSEYKYLVIYSTRNASPNNASIYVRDGEGHEMRGDGYKTYTWNEDGNEQSKGYPNVPDGTGMWLDVWTNQHISIVDLEWLANQNKFGDGSNCNYINTKNITSFGIGATDEGTYINFAYLTNTKPNPQGDYTRDITEFNKFGTICLPYNAACSGAEIYEIAGTEEAGISLNRVYDVMEAGKPYFYKTVESSIGYWDNGVAFRPEEKLYFFKVGPSTVSEAGENNGLIGTFESIVAPQGDNFYVLSGNQLYYTTGATVNVGANKAYIDMSKIAASEAKAAVTLNFGETTRIENIKAAELLKNGKIYDISGREVSHPTRGLYIVNGKKVMIQ